MRIRFGLSGEMVANSGRHQGKVVSGARSGIAECAAESAREKWQLFNISRLRTFVATFVQLAVCFGLFANGWTSAGAVELLSMPAHLMPAHCDETLRMDVSTADHWHITDHAADKDLKRDCCKRMACAASCLSAHSAPLGLASFIRGQARRFYRSLSDAAQVIYASPALAPPIEPPIV
ncbi:hypothetical protein [Variovorax sp. LG9.2]|uniref:hypothetical protein n=1 Tax=Variovorax sp. LG9.2 TaxID=3048626 RepID=UPI002B22A600|nr:hypothetical protein [Variovorax sp. LG9.2]MEB0059672.1 hypothetical protein [Variovorax sp. LG9.2]